MSDDRTQALLAEIRDLLVPISEHYRPEYEQREAQRVEELRARVRSMISSQKRRAAWALADGSRTQREISKQSTLDEGSTSRFFKALRDLGALVDDPNPTTNLEV